MLRNRLLSVDAFRVVANFVIVWVHTRPFMSSAFSGDVRYCGELASWFVRIATPFFFMVAGYFFAVSLARGAASFDIAARLIRRLALFFLFWSLVYVLVPGEVLLHSPDLSYWDAVRVMARQCLSPHFLVNGARVHLWFLPALGSGLALLAIACRLRWERGLLYVAAALYLVGLIAGAYKATPFGLDLGFNTRNGPFFSTVFVVTGFMIHRLDVRSSLRRAYVMITVGVLLRVLELIWIVSHSNTLPSQIDYVLGTYPFAVGVFMLLLTSEGLGKVHWMVKLSRYSAGIYCAHMLFVDVFNGHSLGFAGFVWEVARPLVVLGSTIALVMCMARVPLLKRVVT